MTRFTEKRFSVPTGGRVTQAEWDARVRGKAPIPDKVARPKGKAGKGRVGFDPRALRLVKR